MKRLTIIKIGGKLLDDPEKMPKVLASFSKIKGPKILVHGGGNKSSELAGKLGIEQQMVNGRRITDERTLELVVMVYAGLLNKTVVGKLQALDCNAIGLSGADGNVILAKKRKVGPIDFGYAGDIQEINIPFIETLLNDGLIPVFCAITHDVKGQLLNTNADTIATALATALTTKYVVKLQYLFEKNGVLRDPNDDSSVLSSLSQTDYKKFKKRGIINKGMIPKLDNAFLAKKRNVNLIYIGNQASIEEGVSFKGTEICI